MCLTFLVNPHSVSLLMRMDTYGQAFVKNEAQILLKYIKLSKLAWTVLSSLSSLLLKNHTSRFASSSTTMNCLLYSKYQQLFAQAYLTDFRQYENQLRVTWNLFDIGNTSLCTFRDCFENTLRAWKHHVSEALMFEMWELAAGRHVTYGSQCEICLCCLLLWCNRFLKPWNAGLSHKHLNAPVRRFSKCSLLTADHEITQNTANVILTVMDCLSETNFKSFQVDVFF